MHSQLIKRSRLYLELKNWYQQETVNNDNACQIDNERVVVNGKEQNRAQEQKRSKTSVRQFIQSYDNRSLLITKDNLIKLIMYLHEENIMLSGLNNKTKHTNKNTLEKKQQQEQKLNYSKQIIVQQLKVRKQIYEKQLRQKNKMLTHLRIKVQSIRQYLDEIKKKISMNKNVVESASNNNEKHQQDKQSNLSKKIVNTQYINTNQHVGQKDNNNIYVQQQPTIGEQQNSLQLQQKHDDQSAMLELIKGFELLRQKQQKNNNNNNNNIISSTNKNHHNNSIINDNSNKSNLAINKQKGFISSLRRSTNKQNNLQQSSSSLIETSSFLANYYNPHNNQSSSVNNDGLGSSIRELLLRNDGDQNDNSDVGKQDQQNQLQLQEKLVKKDNNSIMNNIITEQDSVLQTERKKNQYQYDDKQKQDTQQKLQLSISQQSSLQQQNSNQQKYQESVVEKKNNNNKNRDRNRNKNDYQEKNNNMLLSSSVQQQKSGNNKKITGFLNVLNKYNNNKLK